MEERKRIRKRKKTGTKTERMKTAAYIVLQVPGVLLMLTRLYFRFRRYRWAYLRRFRRTIGKNMDDSTASREIYRIQKGMLRFGLRDLIEIVDI